MSIILEGAPVAEAVRTEAAEIVRPLIENGMTPTICLIRANEDEAAISYERSLAKAASALGFETVFVTMGPTASQDDIIGAIEDANMDPGIDGVMVLSPLPDDADPAIVMDAIYPSKDIDGASALSLSRVFTGMGVGYAPATPEAIIRILDHHGIELEGRKAVVIGRSLIVGKPAAMMLLERDATVTLCHSHTPDLADAIAGADIVVSAVGRPRMVTGDLFDDDAGCVVIDVGVNVDEDGSLCGDVDEDSVAPKVSALTPVPGGVGVVVSSVLLLHLAKAAVSRRGEL